MWTSLKHRLLSGIFSSILLFLRSHCHGEVRRCERHRNVGLKFMLLACICYISLIRKKEKYRKIVERLKENGHWTLLRFNLTQTFIVYYINIHILLFTSSLMLFVLQHDVTICLQNLRRSIFQQNTLVNVRARTYTYTYINTYINTNPLRPRIAPSFPGMHENRIPSVELSWLIENYSQHKSWP